MSCGAVHRREWREKISLGEGWGFAMKEVQNVAGHVSPELSRAGNGAWKVISKQMVHKKVIDTVELKARERIRSPRQSVGSEKDMARIES